MSAPDDSLNASSPSPLVRRAERRELPAWLSGVMAGVFLYLFLCAITMMAAGMGELADTEASARWIESLFNQARNPFIAVMASVLITAVVQSSTFTTTLIVTLVGTGVLKVETAVFAVMGANIGTSMTTVIVALGNMRIRRQFRKAFTTAMLHDVFNLLTVSLLFPLEWITAVLSADNRGILARLSGFTGSMMGMESGGKPTNIIKEATSPVISVAQTVIGWVVRDPIWHGGLVALAGLILLLVSLVMMVQNLRGALFRRIEGLFRAVLFRNDLLAGFVGLMATILIQSSTVTTSVMVSLSGAGAVKLRRVYPFLLGANIGTTVTGLVAALAIADNLATEADERLLAVTVAMTHIMFNLVGTCIWYPLRVVPMSIARWYARLASKSTRYAFLFLFLVFFIIPIVGIIATEVLIGRPDGP